jgi:hypothetical protein
LPASVAIDAGRVDEKLARHVLDNAFEWIRYGFASANYRCLH